MDNLEQKKDPFSNDLVKIGNEDLPVIDSKLKDKKTLPQKAVKEGKKIYKKLKPSDETLKKLKPSKKWFNIFKRTKPKIITIDYSRSDWEDKVLNRLGHCAIGIAGLLFSIIHEILLPEMIVV